MYMYMYKLINELLPPTLQKKFNFTHEIHNHNTRKSCMSNIALPLPKISKYILIFQNISKYVYCILVLSYGTLCPQIYETVLLCPILSPVLKIIY